MRKKMVKYQKLKNSIYEIFGTFSFFQRGDL